MPRHQLRFQYRTTQGGFLLAEDARGWGDAGIRLNRRLWQGDRLAVSIGAGIKFDRRTGRERRKGGDRRKNNRRAVKD